MSDPRSRSEVNTAMVLLRERMGRRDERRT